MRLCKEQKTRVRMDSVFTEKFEIKLEMHHRSVLSRFLFAIVVDVVTEFTRGCAK